MAHGEITDSKAARQAWKSELGTARPDSAGSRYRVRSRSSTPGTDGADVRKLERVTPVVRGQQKAMLHTGMAAGGVAN